MEPVPPLPPPAQVHYVTITMREVYDAVLRLEGKVGVLTEQLTSSSHTLKDHENRIRSIEKARWPLPTLSVLTSVAALVIAILLK